MDPSERAVQAGAKTDLRTRSDRMADYDTALRVVWTFLKLDHVHGQSVLLDTLPQGGVSANSEQVPGRWH
ncbi:hypothetical protein OPAG_05017 [Rhodococcus opacus PD630]|nr:hypothetical protein OPAG_05017 [Rhodococcus opacus PD630]